MDSQHQTNAPRDKKEAVQTSINKLRKRFVPGTKYSLIIVAVVDLSMFIIGCLNVHKCPVNIKIPLFLIATGAIGLVSKFVSYVRNRISTHVYLVHFESALYSTGTIFFFLGSYWVYTEFQPSYEPAAGDEYCNKTAYIAAFTYITVFYAIVLAMLFGFCCFLCCILCLAATMENQNPEAPTENSEQLLPNSQNTETKIIEAPIDIKLPEGKS